MISPVELGGYTKDNKKDKVYFYFETKKFEMYLSIKDGKLYNIFDQEVPLGKVSGNFRHVIPEDKYTGNLIKYLTDDVLGGSSVSPYENCST